MRGSAIHSPSFCYVSPILFLFPNSSSFFFFRSRLTLSSIKEASDNSDFGGHRLLPIGKEENGKTRQRRCSCCKEKTSYYCSSPKCSLLWGHPLPFVYICQVATRGFYHRHLEKVHETEAAMSTPIDEAGSSTKRRRRSQEEVRELNNSWDFE